MKTFEHSLLGIYRSVFQRQPWIPPGVALLAARRMWASTQGENSVVAVLDTGVDYNHPDLKANIIGGASFVATEKDYMDHNGHGTQVTGTIAANNQILGVAPAAKILAVKVLNKEGSGSYRGITAGLKFARQWRGAQGQKVNVINMSLGGSEPEAEMYREILRSINSGIIVICAAGSEGERREAPHECFFPAYYPETVAVGAVNLQTRTANFSKGNEHIDISSPGIDTYSTHTGGRYAKLTGTSMAAPHVSGAAALVYSRYQKRFGVYPSVGTVRLLMQYLSIDLGEVGFDNLDGYGMFTFNPDGGKAMQVQTGNKQYYINGQEYQWKNPPLLEGEDICGSYSELSELLGCESRLVPDDDNSSNSQRIMEIWS